MDWSNKSWTSEDKEFAPKREINNRKSAIFLHVSGWLHSHKMNKTVGYESLWGECLFYWYLEMDPQTIRYYPQPVHVPVPYIDDKSMPCDWYHTPDVLVFRNGMRPGLFQLKGSPEKYPIPFEKLNAVCEQYATKRNWSYSVLYPKELPEVIKSNITLLFNYLRPRRNYPILTSEALYKMGSLRECTIIDLARSFAATHDFRDVLPAVYHLISTGHLNTNLHDPITERSVVTAGNMGSQVFGLFEFFE